MKKAPTNRKMRGGYYTPGAIADFILDWGLSASPKSVLEPSCGDGSFLRALQRQTKNDPQANPDEVFAVELDKNEAAKAAESTGYPVVATDFFKFLESKKGSRHFDFIMGNPPFIRYQSFDEECRTRAFSQMQKLGFHPNRLTNIWVPFLVLSANRLSPNGRLGMVIPAELLQVNYAAECREFLSRFFGKLTIVTFKSLLFEGIQQEVVLLLAERDPIKSQASVLFIELDDIESLKALNLDLTTESDYAPLNENKKWTRFFLDSSQRELIARVSSNPLVKKTTELFDTNVGIVSGENSFFLLNKNEVDENKLSSSIRKIVSRTDQLKGIVFSAEDFEDRVREGKKVFLFDVSDGEVESLTKAQRRYIRKGEELGVDENYKCRIRKHWFCVPISWEPTGFIIRQAGAFPRLIVNEANATSTDTVHKVRFHEGVDPYTTSAAFINSFTLALAETVGRSYGGGVLTFEPSEIRMLQIPMGDAYSIDVAYVDDLIRNSDIDLALDYVDEILLVKGLGLSWAEVHNLRSAWKKLSERRLGRK